MERLNSNHAIWLARGVALGAFLRVLLRASRSGAGQAPDIGFRRSRPPKRPWT